MNPRSVYLMLGMALVLGTGASIVTAQDAVAPDAAASEAESSEASEQLAPLTFTAGQAAGGKATYQRVCAECHGNELEGDAAPALSGDSFTYWFDGPVSDLHTYIHELMPADKPGSLSEAQVTTVIAYLAQFNGKEAGGAPLPNTNEELQSVGFEQ